MRKRFLTLEDAVKVAVNHFDADPEIAEIEFEQKCYMSNDQYSIGYRHCLEDMQKYIKEELEK